MPRFGGVFEDLLLIKKTGFMLDKVFLWGFCFIFLYGKRGLVLNTTKADYKLAELVEWKLVNR